MLKITNPTIAALADAILTPEERRLLLVNPRSGLCADLPLSKNALAILASRVADAECLLVRARALLVIAQAADAMGLYDDLSAPLIEEIE